MRIYSCEGGGAQGGCRGYSAAAGIGLQRGRLEAEGGSALGDSQQVDFTYPQYQITPKRDITGFPNFKIQRRQATISATPEPMEGRRARPACSPPQFRTLLWV